MNKIGEELISILTNKVPLFPSSNTILCPVLLSALEFSTTVIYLNPLSDKNVCTSCSGSFLEEDTIAIPIERNTKKFILNLKNNTHYNVLSTAPTATDI